MIALVNADMEERFERLKENISEKQSEYLVGLKEEIEQLREKYHINRELIKQLKYFKDFYKRNMLLGNPNMVSGKFKEALEELKEAVFERKNKKDDEK